MRSKVLKSNILLLITAAIWGFAFVAQRLGAKYIGPFAFNGIRFALGSLSLIPLILYFGKKGGANNGPHASTKATFLSGAIAGTILFAGASLQQLGMSETSAGKAAFITGLYIVLVPILGIFLKQYIRLSSWIGVLVALTGLYFLCVTDKFTIAGSDLYVLVGALFWAMHILAIDHFTKKVDALKLSCIQFAMCAILSLATAGLFEDLSLSGITKATIPILYGGLCSVGIAYTLQVVAQKHAQPAHAAIIMSMETVFASIGGWIILGESLGLRGYLGCGLMLAGMLLSQVQNLKKA